MAWKEVDVVDERERFVLRALEPGACMSSLCREFGISRKTGYKWRDRFKARGRQGLHDMSRRPQHSPLQVSGEIVAAICAIRVRQPRWGSRKIRAVLQRRGVEELPSERTIDRTLQRADLMPPTRRRRRRTIPSTAQPPLPSAPNDLWTVDFKGWWRTKDSKRCEPLTIRDSLSRFVLEAKIAPRPDVETVQPIFEDAFRRYGLPKAILSDNGSPFASTRALGGLSRLSAYWVALGIAPYRIAPGKPQQNGAHERMHRDMKAELQSSPSNDLSGQQESLSEWRFTYNQERPHEALGMRTPAELYRPSPRKYRGERPVLAYPTHFEVRRVTQNGSVKYHQRHRFVSEALKSWDIGLERTQDGIHIWFGDLLLGKTDSEFDAPVEPIEEES